MKLYSVDLSPYAARVRMQIYAKGLDDVVIERPAGWGTPAFRERFPIGRIPVLDIDGDLIVESEVIAEHLEAVCPEPSLLGASPLETARIRTLARLGDIYLINNIFLLAPQALGSSPRNESLIELLGPQVVRNVEALDRMVGDDGFACSGRLTLADCTLVPALFLVENVLPGTGIENPIPRCACVAAYWAAIRQQPAAARILAELNRGLEERRELIRSRPGSVVATEQIPPVTPDGRRPIRGRTLRFPDELQSGGGPSGPGSSLRSARGDEEGRST